MKQYYKITPITIIENNKGTYEVWCEKSFCFNHYKFFAYQVSVKVNDKHYYVGRDKPYFEYIKLKPNFTYEYNTVNSTCIDTHIIQMEILRYLYIGKITRYKIEFEYFKQNIINNNITL